MCQGEPSGRDDISPAPHLPGAHPPAGAIGADSRRSGVAPTLSLAPPSHPALRLQARAHLAPGACLHRAPAAARPPALCTPAAASFQARRPLTTLGGWRRIRTGWLGTGSREYEPGTAREEPLLPTEEATAAAAPPALFPHCRVQLPGVRPCAQRQLTPHPAPQGSHPAPPTRCGPALPVS